jgi:hypothetical protein
MSRYGPRRPPPMRRKKRSRPGESSAAAEHRLAAELSDDARSLLGEMSAARTQLLQSVQEANERCIELLVLAARTDAVATFPVVNHLRSVFRGLTPEIRAKAARTALLLVDMRLGDVEWWTHLQAHPARPVPLPASHGSFPRASAVPLGRAVLMLAWHAVRSDPVGSCLLGVGPKWRVSFRASHSPSSTGRSSAAFGMCVRDGRIVLRFGAHCS